MGLGASLVLIGIEIAIPDVLRYEDLAGIIRQIDFQKAVLNGMLAFLLFAGALHVNLAVLRNRAWAVGSMATIGTIISTAIVGIGFWLAAHALAVPMPFAWVLVFGALISPTDPLAMLSTLKAVHVPKTLEIDMTGESLFNDGVPQTFTTKAYALISHRSASSAPHSPDENKASTLVSMLSRGGAPAGVVGSLNAVWGVNRAVPSSHES